MNDEVAEIKSLLLQLMSKLDANFAELRQDFAEMKQDVLTMKCDAGDLKIITVWIDRHLQPCWRTARHADGPYR